MSISFRLAKTIFLEKVVLKKRCIMRVWPLVIIRTIRDIGAIRVLG